MSEKIPCLINHMTQTVEVDWNTIDKMQLKEIADEMFKDSRRCIKNMESTKLVRDSLDRDDHDGLVEAVLSELRSSVKYYEGLVEQIINPKETSP